MKTSVYFNSFDDKVDGVCVVTEGGPIKPEVKLEALRQAVALVEKEVAAKKKNGSEAPVAPEPISLPAQPGPELSAEEAPDEPEPVVSAEVFDIIGKLEDAPEASAPKRGKKGKSS